MKNGLLIISLLVTIILTSCTKQKTGDVELVIDSQSDLGDGAIWNYKTGQLIWVNVTGEIMNFYRPKIGNNKEMFTGQMIGSVVPAESGMVLVALQNGIYKLNPETGTKSLIVDPEEDIATNRFNDGKCDPSGRFWAGTVSLEGQPGAGTFYRFDPDSSVHKMIENVTTSNGIAWSNDLKKMYFIDKSTQKIMEYEYDNATGDISNSNVVVEIPVEMGSPDGMTIDSEGNLWVALWGGAAVGCWNPETGKLLRKIEVPAKNVTSCAFGDEDLSTLYITTARQGTTEEELENYPNAGGVFKIRPGVRGVNASFFNDKN